jgi:two-component system, OmpR family, phosphate regulon sensor histidine kinase PhoR
VLSIELITGILTGLLSVALLAASPFIAYLLAILSTVLIVRSFYKRRSEVTVQKREEKLKSSTLRFDSISEGILSQLPEGLVVLNSDLRVIAANRAATEMFRSAAQLEGRKLTELTRNPQVHSAFRLAIKEKESEVKFQLPGSRESYQLRVTSLKHEDQTLAVGLFFNVTKLEKLETVRQEFLSNISHELRTPLTSIIAYIETLEDGGLEDIENRGRFLSIIRRNADRMSTLIKDILELSAIESGTVKVERVEVDLYTMVEDLISFSESSAQSNSVTLENRVEHGAKVFADVTRLEQMLTNLVDNAIKFNKVGGRIAISHTRATSDCIMVSDTGDGIQPEHLDRIFERFYRVDRARAVGGTGLGLAIVKHLARAHGGDVRVESRPSEGTTFIIELPVKNSFLDTN